MIEKRFNMSRTSDNHNSTLNNELSRIAQGVIIKGDISSRSDIRIDGHMEGKLYSEGRVVLGETSLVKGSIICNDIDLYGKVEGDIYVSNVLSIKGTAIVNGNINVRKLQVEMGAQLNGTCAMINEDTFNTLKSEVVSLEIDKNPSEQEVSATETAENGVEVSVDTTAEEAEEEKKSRKSPFRY